MTAPLAYGVKDAAQACSVSTTTIERALAAGELVAKYSGAGKSKRVILADELGAWLHALPETRGGTR